MPVCITMLVRISMTAARFPSSLIYNATYAATVVPKISPSFFKKRAYVPQTRRAGHTFSHVESGDNCLKISWDDGVHSRYPLIHLRECCKCPECFEPSSRNRIPDIFRDVAKIDANLVTYEQSGHHLLCTWGNGHQSVYPVNWLHKTRLPEKNTASSPDSIKYSADDIVHKDLIIWDHDQLQDNIPTFDYSTVMKDDKVLFDALYSLYQYGLMLLDNGPIRTGVYHDLAKRIGFLRATNYGAYFDVKNKSNPSNLAYTPGPLPFHVDLLYFTLVPEIQTLHCIKQVPEGKGGENVFSNAYKAAIDLLKEKPEYFEILAKMDINFHDFGEDWSGPFNLGYKRPICELNKNGRLFSVNVNNFSRADYFSNITVDECLAFYEAYYALGRKLYDQRYYVEHRLQEGQVVLFHNTRVLHSRKPLEARYERLLQGTYYEWDVIFSKLRIIQEKLGLNTPKLHPLTNDMF